MNNLDDSIKYKSLYYKKRLGDINICFNNSNMFSNLCINGNKIKFKNLLKCIMNYDGFLLKFQILKGSLE
ncbi:hypothetical protein [Clostridium tetanomorphum]|uniref:hypothetical protein n=1 Tax=Clostridium tetanomorphum TaxID=1553 RepID=UPI000D85B047|nr:hypothetical protein [Clostridium tetanomorphum]SQC01770.1 Uncharacterised protein [Clostridium tetanomorphum]